MLTRYQIYKKKSKQKNKKQHNKQYFLANATS